MSFHEKLIADLAGDADKMLRAACALYGKDPNDLDADEKLMVVLAAQKRSPSTSNRPS